MKLADIDPDDMGEIVAGLALSFNIDVENADFSEMCTFGDLCDFMEQRVPGTPADTCTTQQAFYKVRAAIAEVLGTDIRSIHPDTDLKMLIPRKGRRKKIRIIEDMLGFETQLLEPPRWLTTLLVVIFLTSVMVIFYDWKFGITGLIISWLTIRCASRLGNELYAQTVGQLVARTSREHYFKMRRDPSTVNKKEIVQKIKETFSAIFDIHEQHLTRDASLGW